MLSTHPILKPEVLNSEAPGVWTSILKLLCIDGKNKHFLERSPLRLVEIICKVTYSEDIELLHVKSDPSLLPDRGEQYNQWQNSTQKHNWQKWITKSVTGYRIRVQQNQTKHLQVSGTTQSWSQLQPNPDLYWPSRIPLGIFIIQPYSQIWCFLNWDVQMLYSQNKMGPRSLTSRVRVLAGRGQCVNIQHWNPQAWFLRSLGWCSEIWWETATFAQETEGDSADFLIGTTQKEQSKKRELFLKELFKLR